MKIARSTAHALLVGPAIVIGTLAGASQAAHAATPATHSAYAPASPDTANSGRTNGWDPRWGDPRWRYYNRPGWGYRPYAPTVGYYPYTATVGYHPYVPTWRYWHR